MSLENKFSKFTFNWSSLLFFNIFNPLWAGSIAAGMYFLFFQCLHSPAQETEVQQEDGRDGPTRVWAQDDKGEWTPS